MATIRRRGDSWQAQVRRRDQPAISRSFKKRDDALKWSRGVETAIDEGRQTEQQSTESGPTLSDLLDRYEREITPHKRSNDREYDKLRVIRRHAICKISAAKLKSCDIISYRDLRLTLVKPSTVKRELAIIRHCIEIATREWSLPLTLNPAHRIRLPNADVARSRMLDMDEQARFWTAIKQAKSWYLKPMVILAIETGMRRGEMLAISISHLNVLANTLFIPVTKNGHSRTIPLTPTAVSVLKSMPERNIIFPVSKSSLRQSWVRLLKRAGISDFRWHDLRHWAITTMFSLGLNVPEVALVSGHRSYRMLQRYVHLRPENVAQKLARLTSESRQS